MLSKIFRASFSSSKQNITDYNSVSITGNNTTKLTSWTTSALTTFNTSFSTNKQTAYSTTYNTLVVGPATSILTNITTSWSTIVASGNTSIATYTTTSYSTLVSQYNTSNYTSSTTSYNTVSGSVITYATISGSTMTLNANETFSPAPGTVAPGYSGRLIGTDANRNIVVINEGGYTYIPNSGSMSGNKGGRISWTSITTRTVGSTYKTTSTSTSKSTSFVTYNYGTTSMSTSVTTTWLSSSYANTSRSTSVTTSWNTTNSVNTSHSTSISTAWNTSLNTGLTTNNGTSNNTTYTTLFNTEIKVAVPFKDNSLNILMIGQSNIANYGERTFTYTANTNVKELDLYGNFIFTKSPANANSLATGTGGNMNGLIGDAVLSALPYDAVNISNVAVGGTKISWWLKDAPTDSYVVRAEDKFNYSNNRLFERIVFAKNIADIKEQSFTHVLLHIGESDGIDNTSVTDYKNSVLQLIRDLYSIGINVPIILGKVSYSWGTFYPNMIIAQNELIAENEFIVEGPNTDLFNSTYRHDDLHFNALGLTAIAEQWKNSIVSNSMIFVNKK